MSVAGRHAIVTGAGRMRGIGRGTANVLARMGANVVITGTGRDPATFPDDEKQAGWRDIQSTAEEVEAHGVRALPLIVNVADEDDVEKMIDATLAEFGRIDIIVNNAGYTWDSVVQKMTDEQWQAIIDVHMTAPFKILRAAQPVISAKAKEELERKQHYAASVEYRAYADLMRDDPELWCKWSEKYINWRQLEILGLMSKGNWA